MFKFNLDIDSVIRPACEEAPPQVNKDWMTVLVSVQRPAPEELNALNRSARHAILCKNAEHWRKELLGWIDAQGLQAEVRWVGIPTVFSLIIVVCRSRAAKLLAEAPGVTNVIVAGDPALDIGVI
jgi:hypothetical protein